MEEGVWAVPCVPRDLALGIGCPAHHPTWSATGGRHKNSWWGRGRLRSPRGTSSCLWPQPLQSSCPFVPSGDNGFLLCLVPDLWPHP